MKSSFKWIIIRITAMLMLVLVIGAGSLYYMLNMPGKPADTELPPLTAAESAISERLHKDVVHLAGEIGERNTEQPGSLARTVDYLQSRFRQAGVVANVLEYSAGEAGSFINLEVELYGDSRPHEILVIGAHYDSAWPAPGADDNASGIAVLLELARRFAGRSFDRTIRLVAFANEESPHYGTSSMGSKVYARQVSRRGEEIVGMFSLEMLGYYDNRAGSQDFPAPIKPFYPDRGNFLAFVANLASGSLLRDAIGGFRRHASLPSYGIAAPVALVPDIRRSDHAMFWQQGYPAVMITDTAGFRNPHYHRHSDLPGTLDYDRMARAVTGLQAMLTDLASAP